MLSVPIRLPVITRERNQAIAEAIIIDFLKPALKNEKAMSNSI